MTTSRQKAEQLADDLGVEERQRDRANIEISTLKRLLSETKGEVHTSENEIQRLRTKLSDVRGDVHRLKAIVSNDTEIDKLRSDCVRLKNNNFVMLARLKDSQRQTDDAVAEAAELKKEVIKQRDIANDLYEDFADCNERRASACAKLVEVRSGIEDLLDNIKRENYYYLEGPAVVEKSKALLEIINK